MKKTLTFKAEGRAFTRATDTKYTHAILWDSPRVERDLSESRSASGVCGRWLKDNGGAVGRFATTWHTSEAAARRAASRPYGWDRAARAVGVFAVEQGE